jgi:quercetin dioxygenase-like cupin family protein
MNLSPLYTILIGGEATRGAYCLIGMLVPPGGGPAPHRHDFEEMFYLAEGEIVFTFRGQSHTAKEGAVVNIPANAPHAFRNNSGRMARLICMCTPAGQEDFFRQVGTPARNAQDPAPELSEPEMKAFAEKARRLAPRYRTELLLNT